MPSEHRARLVEILALLDQLETGATEIMAAPVRGDILARIENIREELVELSAVVEQYLDND